MGTDSRNLQKYPPILFDEARRREFVDPEALIDLINLQAGAVVADLGAGAGFFTIPLGRVVGAKGKVYAVDINPNNLSIIRGKTAQEKLTKVVQLLEGNVETGKGVTIKDESLDAIILSSVLSQFANKEQVLDLAEQLLKPGGRLVIFEWHQRDMLLGPPPNARIAKEAVINRLFAHQRHFQLNQDVDVGFYHYCLVFEKK